MLINFLLNVGPLHAIRKGRLKVVDITIRRLFNLSSPKSESV